MSFPTPNIEDLKKLHISELRLMADNLFVEYKRLVREEPFSFEIIQFRGLIAIINDIIYEKSQNGELKT